jgi:dihydrolipoamide dehydrogenase
VAVTQTRSTPSSFPGWAGPKRDAHGRKGSILATISVDAIVIGAGPGGYHAAIRLGQLGKNVVCFDRDEVGGVCLNWGCIPTKALLHVGEVVRQIDHAAQIGITVPKAQIDRAGVAKFRESVVKANVGGVQSLFKANKVTFAYGDVSFTGKTTVSLKQRDGITQDYTAPAIVIATGSAPIDVKAWPRDRDTIINSDDAVGLARIPQNLLIVGGGVIGLEFATVYTRMGAKTLVVEALPNLLTGTDLEISKTLGRILKKQGVEIALSTTVESLEKVADHQVKATINGEYTNNKPVTREFDMVLVAVGRRPVTDTLNLAATGLSTDEKGFIAVDQQMRTAVSGIYAIGDVTGQPLLAHRAMKQGVVAAEVIAGDKSSAFDPVAIPNCVYTDITVGKFPLIASGRARTMNETDGLIKLIGDAKTDLLLGMHIVAPQAESLIGEGVIALEMGATIEDIGLSIHPHPTLTESIMDAAELIHGKAIHVLNPKPKPKAPAAV